MRNFFNKYFPPINPQSSREAYMRPCTGQSFVHVMAFAKLLSEPMLTYYHLDPLEPASVKINQTLIFFKNIYFYIPRQMASKILFKPQCIKFNPCKGGDWWIHDTRYHGSVFYVWLNKVSGSERKCYISMG